MAGKPVADGLAFLAAECRHFDILRPNPQDDGFRREIRAPPAIDRGKSAPRWCRLPISQKTNLVAVLLQRAGDKIHRRTAEKSGDEQIDRLIVERRAARRFAARRPRS